MKNRQRNPSLGHPNMRRRSFHPRRFSSLRCFHLWTAKKVMIRSACDCGQTSMLVVIECIAVSYPKHLARKHSFWTCLLQRFHTDKASQVASENSKDLRFLKHVKLLLQFLAKQHLRLKGATETHCFCKTGKHVSVKGTWAGQQLSIGWPVWRFRYASPGLSESNSCGILLNSFSWHGMAS